MSGRRLALLFAAAFALALVVLLPLGVALRVGSVPPSLRYAAAQGSLWNGRLEDVRVAGLALGDVDADLAALPLALGRVRLDLRAAHLRMRLLDGGRRGVEHAHGALPLDLPGAAGAATLHLDDVAIVFADGACRQAGGRVVLDLALGDALPPQRLEGAPACSGQRAGLVLAGNGAVPLEAKLEIAADGRATLHMTSGIETPALRAAGFTSGPTGASLVREARLFRAARAVSP